MLKDSAMIASLVHYYNPKVPKKVLAACTLDIHDAISLLSSLLTELF